MSPRITIGKRVNADGTVSFFARWADAVTGRDVRQTVCRTEPKPTQRSLRAWRRRAAEQVYRLQQMLAGGPGRADPIEPTRIETARARFLDWCQEPTPDGVPNAEPGTVRNKDRITADFVQFLRATWSPGPRFMHHLRRSYVAQWRQELVRRGLGAATINSYVATLASWFAWAVDFGTMATNPCHDLKRFKVDNGKRAAPAITTFAALADLLGQTIPDGRVRDAAVILATTGMRQGEARALCWTDWNAAAGTLTIPGRTVERTKRHARTIPLTDQATETLHRMASARSETSGPYILGVRNHHKPLTSQLNAWLKPYGIRPHDLRRTYRVLMESLGAPGEIIDDLMGHRTTRVRAAYTPEINVQAAARWVRRFGDALRDAMTPEPSAQM